MIGPLATSMITGALIFAALASVIWFSNAAGIKQVDVELEQLLVGDDIRVNGFTDGAIAVDGLEADACRS